MQYQDFKCLHILDGHQEAVESIAVSKDGTLLVSGSYDATIKIWDLKTYQTERTLDAHRSGIVSVALASDQRILASGSRDRTTRI